MDTLKILLLLLLTANTTIAGNIRDHTRPKFSNNTLVTQSQATDLTLTLVKTERHNLQTWLRLAATLDESGQNLLTKHCSQNNTIDANLIKLGQRVRAFPPDSKSSIYQARIYQLKFQDNCLLINARLTRKPRLPNRHYVMEIIVERGQFLSIPKEAIIEESDKKIVYLQQQVGDYIPREILTGIKGEFYTEIIKGLTLNDTVVTLGSFFIDAETKLKSTKQTETGHAHHHH